MKELDFSLERAAEDIPSQRTREYFREVYSDYVNGAYRSAVVMLWSVVVCDLLFKLDELALSFDDATARTILEEIRTLQENNPTSPEWEMKLVEKVKDRTSLLEPAEFEGLVALQRQRHLAAHPVLTSDFTLSSPNRDTVRAFMRSALEGVLIKPALLTRKVFDLFVEDLEDKRDVLVTDEDLERYLEARFFRRIPAASAATLFRSLWKIVFRLDDERCKKNRVLNLRALLLLYAREAQTLRGKIEGDASYYSEVHVDGGRGAALFRFLARFPEVFRLMSDEGRALVEGKVKTDKNYETLAWFMAESFTSHVTVLSRKVSSGEFEFSKRAYSRLLDAAQDSIMRQSVLALGALLYTESRYYDTADDRYDDFVAPHIDEWEQATFEECFRGIDANSQTYERRRGRGNHKTLLATYRGLSPACESADLADCPHLLEGLGEKVSGMP